MLDDGIDKSRSAFIVAYHKISVLIVDIIEQPFLWSVGISESKDTATGRSGSHGGTCITALSITWVVSGEPLSGFVEWNTCLVRRLDQLAWGCSITIDSADTDGAASDDTTTTVGGDKASTGALLGAAALALLLETSVGLGINDRPSSRDSLLGSRGHRDNGKDEEELLH